MDREVNPDTREDDRRKHRDAGLQCSGNAEIHNGERWMRGTGTAFMHRLFDLPACPGSAGACQNAGP